jgi:glycosyltransferase involved in cell wall biosynthesis
VANPLKASRQGALLADLLKDMSQLQILRCIPTMDPRWGGPCQGIRNAEAALSAAGIASEVVSSDCRNAPWLTADSFTITPLGPGKFGYSYSAQMLPWLRRNLSRFDAVIVHTLWQWHGAAVLLALNEMKRHLEPLPALFVMPHGGLDPWYQRDSSRRLKALRNIFYWWAIERRLINSADAVLFTSREEGELARTTFPGYAPKSEFCVRYGIPKAPICIPRMAEAFRKSVPTLPIGRRYFLYLGRIHPKKGVDWLVEAYGQFVAGFSLEAEVPSLVIAGPGQESSFGQRVSRMVEKGGLKKQIHFAGMLEGDGKWGALYGCEASVMCSHQENFGIALVEALSCDRPVLITDKVNIWREIKADGGGWVCEQDRSAFANLLQQWVRTGKNSEALTPKQCYEKNFGIEQHAQVFTSTIRTVLAEREIATSP